MFKQSWKFGTLKYAGVMLSRPPKMISSSHALPWNASWRSSQEPCTQFSGFVWGKQYSVCEAPGGLWIWRQSWWPGMLRYAGGNPVNCFSGGAEAPEYKLANSCHDAAEQASSLVNGKHRWVLVPKLCWTRQSLNDSTDKYFGGNARFNRSKRTKQIEKMHEFPYLFNHKDVDNALVDNHNMTSRNRLPLGTAFVATSNKVKTKNVPILATFLGGSNKRDPSRLRRNQLVSSIVYIPMQHTRVQNLLVLLGAMLTVLLQTELGQGGYWVEKTLKLSEIFWQAKRLNGVAPWFEVT